MAEAPLVRDCVAAMRDAVGDAMPVTVKHRIGIDRIEDYGFVRDFVGEVARGGCEVFIVHARNAWLDGLSPKDNREVPPLRPEFVYRLKQEFPQLRIVLNGGVRDDAQLREHLRHVDGVMVAREDQTPSQVVRRLVRDYIEQRLGRPWKPGESLDEVLGDAQPGDAPGRS